MGAATISAFLEGEEMSMDYSGPAEKELAALLAATGVTAGESSAWLEGELPVLASPHRIPLAAGLALLTQGAATAALWEQLGGRPQEIRLAAHEVVPALNPLPWLRRNGHPAIDLAHLAQPCGGYFRTRDDRTFFITAAYPKLVDGTLRLLDRPNDATAIADAVAGWDSLALEEAFVDAGLTGALVRTAEEWRATEQGRAVAASPLVSIERIGDADPVPLPDSGRPLGGVRVADVTHVFAGPMLSRGLAEQGADVLHLGPLNPRLADPIGLALATGIGKRSAVLDLTGDGPRTLTRLLRDADVLVQSWRPGMLDRHGFGPAEAAALRPGLIYVSVACYGCDGPWDARGGFDPVALASTGMTADEALRDTHKLSPPGILTDSIAAFLGAAAVTSLLGRRAREGGSWHVRLSLARMATWIQSLGLHPEGTAATPDPAEPGLAAMPSPFGDLDYLRPALRYSETPAWLDKPAVPVGASKAEWLPR